MGCRKGAVIMKYAKARELYNIAFSRFLKRHPFHCDLWLNKYERNEYYKEMQKKR